MKTSNKLAVILLVSICAKFSGKTVPALGNVSTVISMLTYLYFLYEKAPNFLNKHFQTSIFKSDRLFRFSLALIPLLLFIFVLVTAPTIFLPPFLYPMLLVRFDAGTFFLAGFVSLMSISFIFTWRLLSKHNSTLVRILTKIEDPVDIVIDRENINKGGRSRFFAVFQIGEEIALLCLILVLFWLAMWTIDYAFLVFTGAWLAFDVLKSNNPQRHRYVAKVLVKINRLKEEDLFWKAFTIGTAFGSEGSSITILAMISICFSGMLLVLSFSYPILFLVWVLLSGWYVLFITFPITKRLNFQMQWIIRREKGVMTYREIPKEDFAIYSISILYMVAAYGIIRSNMLNSGTILPYYQSLKMGFEVFSQEIPRNLSMWGLICFANVVTVYSIVQFARKATLKTVTVSHQSYFADKSKLAWLGILAGLLVAEGSTDALFPLLVTIGVFIVWCFHDDLNLVAPRMSALKYACVTAAIDSVVCGGVFSLISLLSLYTEKAEAFFRSLMMPVMLILVALTTLHVIACYRDQTKRLRIPQSSVEK